MKEVIEPFVGMKFASPDEAYEFYKTYSCKVGFGITRRTSHNFYGFKYDVTFCCNKNRPPISAIDQEGYRSRCRGIIGTGCKARLVVRDRLLNGSWCVEEVELQHNHDLRPDCVRLMRCHRELPLFVKKQLEVNECVGLAQSKSISAVFTQAGGVTQCMFTDRDMRNYIADVKRLKLKGGDAAALMRYFRKQQTHCPNFWYTHDVDDEGRLKNVFWTDGRSRAAFKFFGDVVTFDSTYLTNRYRMPFALFVGVNHHGQSVLLGCALLSNEFKETYEWVFRAFIECMNAAPQAIITDQCGSIGAAVRDVFCGTRHRLCLWHIMKKLPEKLIRVQCRDEGIVPHAPPQDLRGHLPYNWACNGAVNRVKYMFMPFVSHGHWILIQFNFETKSVTVWNTLKENGPYKRDAEEVIQIWKNYLANVTGKDDLLEAPIEWNNSVQQCDSSDCALFTMKIMECIVTGGDLAEVTQAYISRVRVRVVYNMLAVQFYENLLLNIYNLA